jgi:hypothetical protein
VLIQSGRPRFSRAPPLSLNGHSGLLQGKAWPQCERIEGLSQLGKIALLRSRLAPSQLQKSPE